MSDTDPPFSPDAVRRRRLRYRATHRGSHECDLLLGGYVIAHLDDMDAATLDALEEVLELPDNDLARRGAGPWNQDQVDPLRQLVEDFVLPEVIAPAGSHRHLKHSRLCADWTRAVLHSGRINMVPDTFGFETCLVRREP